MYFCLKKRKKRGARGDIGSLIVSDRNKTGVMISGSSIKKKADENYFCD